MVHSQPRLWGRGIIIALALTFAHAPLQAQTRVSATSAQEQARLQERTDSKLQGNKLRTRFVVGLPKRAEYEVFSLNNPNRVIVELGETRLRLPAQPEGKAVGLIKRPSSTTTVTVTILRIRESSYLSICLETGIMGEGTDLMPSAGMDGTLWILGDLTGGIRSAKTSLFTRV